MKNEGGKEERKLSEFCGVYRILEIVWAGIVRHKDEDNG